jgi:hypothetical protein
VAALSCTFFILCVSLYLASAPSRSRNGSSIESRATPPTPIVYLVNRTDDGRVDVLSDEVTEAYLRDGVVAIRGLAHPMVIERARRETDTLLNPKPRKGGQFHTAHHNSLFVSAALWEIAVESDIPSVAHQLLQRSIMAGNSDKDGRALERQANITSLRVLRDIFLAKASDDEYICGWHVDDFGFWPSTPQSPGINAWIALEEDQSSFALAVGSHRASWRHRAYYETGAPIAVEFPDGGYANASDYVLRRTGSGTCNIKRSAPDLHQLMEETKRIYTLQPGDVVFHARWLFHRTVVSSPRESSSATSLHRRMERRYSVRYAPGTATIPPGYGTELSVLSNPDNGGRTADKVSTVDGPWYPQVWPAVLDEERRGTPDLVRDKFPAAMALRKARESELAPLVRQISRERSGSLLPKAF